MFHKKQVKYIQWIFSIVAIIIIPHFLDAYLIYISSLVCIFIILAIGLDLVIGYTGQISLCHAAFFAIGAYTSAILTTKAGIPFWFSMPLGAVTTALIGFCVGIPALRLGGLYLALVTLGFGEIVQMVTNNWILITNGPDGIVIPSPELVGFSFSSDLRVFYIIMPITICLVTIGRNIVQSNIGRAFIAVRDDEIAAQSFGMRLARYKTISFSLSAFYAGIGGGLYTVTTNFICPTDFGIVTSIDVLAMIVIGGLGTIIGPIFGAILLTLLPEILRTIAEIKELAYGSLLLIFLIFMPGGIWGILSNLLIKVRMVFPLTTEKKVN